NTSHRNTSFDLIDHLCNTTALQNNSSPQQSLNLSVNFHFEDGNDGKFQSKSTTITPLIHNRSPHLPPTASDNVPQYPSYANSAPHNRHRNFLLHHHDLFSHGRLLHIHLDNTQNARIPSTLYTP
ncbi:hypothetical protein D6D24_08423, partial [Aureobasidium pullulans]